MSFSAFDHQCMSEALRLAQRGLYTTDPNPRVACVLARQQQIVGRGWHEQAGGPHAEIMAFSGLEPGQGGLSAYVTLEPCCYHGRTPPCTDVLIEQGVSRLVVASLDPNPRVNGSGIKKLRSAGIVVETGLMAQEAEALNRGFYQRMKAGRPWVRIKSAISLDGRTALKNGESQWITSAESREDVQRWRARSSAILTGIGTVLHDDPSMDARVSEVVRQPLKVIVDSHWQTPPGSKILKFPENVLIAGSRETEVPGPLHEQGIECLQLGENSTGIDLGALLAELANREINEIQVEAGSRLCASLLKQGLVDELLLYQAPLVLGEGGPGIFALGPLESMAERTHFKVLESVRLGVDLRIQLQVEKT